MIELSNRLGQIARMVQPGSVVADIGTDHGQLMVYLAQNGTIRRGYACDINEKPLNKARQIIADYGLEDRIECVLASGLDGLQPGSVDTVVIAAPYWDLTFPAVLRLYLEQVSVAGIAFRYTHLGRPIGLCRARRLYYVTTAGGPIGARNLGFQYVQELAGSFFGIPRLTCFSAEKLDMLDTDVPAILQQAVAEMEKALPPAVKRPQAP